MGDSQYTQNIQINKVIGENVKCLLFYGKNLKGLFGPPNISLDLPQHLQMYREILTPISVKIKTRMVMWIIIKKWKQFRCSLKKE